jgi:hypothetical protein
LFGTGVTDRHAQVRGGIEKVVGADVTLDFTRFRRSLKQRTEGGAETLLTACR